MPNRPPRSAMPRPTAGHRVGTSLVAPHVEGPGNLLLQLHFDLHTAFLSAADRRRGRIRTALTIAQLAKCNCRSNCAVPQIR